MDTLRTAFDSNGHMTAEIIRRKANRAPEAWRRANKRMGDLWLLNVKSLSSVQYASLAQLAAMGHPYGRQHFRGPAGNKASRARTAAIYALPAPPFNINVQSGKLFAGWGLKILEGNDYTRIQITNTEKYFGYLHKGTKWMIPRPILEVALARASKEFPAAYTAAQMHIHGYAQ